MSNIFVRKTSSLIGSFNLKNLSKFRIVPVRRLNLLEYQSKELLRDSGVSVQNFTIVDDIKKTVPALKTLSMLIYLYISFIFF